ncbi:MAG: hypothetical protein CM15mP62_20450 [Rhodospirillaceae bacterium]|nr:MAG: hypothetical protein CM15mP62_20450 [Rhodospirillaceae bacterium]
MFTDCIPLGGKHITNDIARGLSTSIVNAERIKTLHGNAFLSPFEDRDTIEIPQIGEENGSPPNLVAKSKVIQIIQPRVEETLELVRESISNSGFEGIAGHRIVLTGGASQLPGMREIVQENLKSKCGSASPFELMA